jgi:hypothetical protein
VGERVKLTGREEQLRREGSGGGLIHVGEPLDLESSVVSHVATEDERNVIVSDLKALQWEECNG